MKSKFKIQSWMFASKSNSAILYIIFCFILFSCNRKPKEVLAENEYYACSMDPQVLEKQMGMCPICKMPLAKITFDKTQLRIIKLNEQQMKLANVKVDSVKLSFIGNETVLTGVFNVNQNRSEQISSRISGKIEKLYHKIVGEEIMKGEPVYELYSQELVLAQEEYIIAIDKYNSPNSVLGNESIVNSARNKLLLWGLTEEQVFELEKTKRTSKIISVYSKVSGTITEIPVQEGSFVDEGSMIYKLVDLTSLWVEAQIFSGELALLKEGMKVEIIPDAFPEEATVGTITFSNPELQNQSKINLVRVEVNNPWKKLRPGMHAYIIHHTEEKEAILLPVDAVIRDPRISTVWVQNKDGGFEARKVTTGIENKFNIEIVSGLSIGEIVVVSGTYLIHSEYVFKKGLDPGVRENPLK